MRFACPSFLSWLEKKATVVTPSPLLAAVAAQQAAEYQLEHGRDSFERGPIYSIDAWLSACWQDARYSANAPLLLSPLQERALCQSIIESEHPHLFDPNAAARLARRAASLIAEWNIPIEGDFWNDHQDARQFQIWFRLFRRRCHEEGWITRSDLWRLVPKWIAEGVLNRDLTVFAAFETTTPALQNLMQALGNSAIVELAVAPVSPQRSAAKSFSTFAEELEDAARFARAAFERDPSQSIAVFVPDLAAHRPTAQRVFENIFYPSRAFSRARDHLHSVFHVNAAVPLREHPVAANALLLLELARPRIHHADAQAILRSPFIAGAADERSARAFADLELRKRRDLDVTLRDIESVSGNCPLLGPIWSAVRRVLHKMPKQAELPAWSEFMRDLLRAASWPGSMPLTVPDQVAVDEWNETLSSLAALGVVLERAGYDAALAHLRGLLSAPRLELGDWFSPVQILDAKDAHALEFDCAVLTGLSDETWPPAIELSPLIPLTVQRAHHVPESSQLSAHASRERLTENLFQSAPVLLTTYTGRLSPMAERFIDRPETPIALWSGKLPVQSFPPASLDEKDDTNAPPYVGRDIARGGTSLIKSQSLCPFRAFAEFRLEAKAPEDACFGFDARDRGGFVHRALQLVWQTLHTQRELRSASNDRLRAIVQDAVAQAVSDDESSPLHQLVSSAERERLENVILDWLRIERARKLPFTVETVEQECCYEIPGLRLKLRVDRIDRLENGKVLLIDYKSGKQSREKLKCPRPAEPQLLVYAAASDDGVDGVFFGELKARAPRAVGFSREKQFENGSSISVMKHGWEAFLRCAEDEVERIASQFVQGYAAAHPVHNACEYCSIKPLCRINESAATEGEKQE